MSTTIALSENVRQPKTDIRCNRRNTSVGLSQVPTLIVPQPGLCITFSLPAITDVSRRGRN
jgi:hypothetical protein